MSLEELEKSIYKKDAPKRDSRGEEPKTEDAHATEVEAGAPLSWKENAVFKPESPVPKKARVVGINMFFWVVIAAIIVASLGAFYASQFFKAGDIALTARVSLPDGRAGQDALIGQQFEIVAKFSNNLNDTIDNLRISLVLPEGASAVGEGDVRVVTRTAGPLAPNKTTEEIFAVINTDSAQIMQKFDIIAYYNLAGALAKINFDRKISVVVSFAGPAVSIDLSAPRQVFANEIFPITVRYRNESGADFSGGQIVLSYPSGFIFKGANPRPTSGNSVWDILKVPSGGEGSIIIEGSILSAAGAELHLSAAFRSTTGIVDEKGAIIATAYSPVVLRIIVNDSDNYITRPGDSLRYKIQYTNNSETALQFATISAKLSGAMFDIVSLSPGSGDFDSRNRTITWQMSNTPPLGVVDANRVGDVSFSIRLLPDYPIRRLSDKNFSVVVDAQFSSPTVPPTVTAQNTTAIIRGETKIAGRTTISAKASSVPLAVDRTSPITITWAISTLAADFDNITARAVLEGGVEWEGNESSNITASVPVYNPRTKEVVWTIESLGANRGAVERAAQATFVVRATPSILQAGRRMPLTSKTEMSATDVFSGISAGASALHLESDTVVR